MVLVDDQKTVIAGEAGKVMVEMALIIDRFLLELEEKGGSKSINYDKAMKKFIALMAKVRAARIQKGADMSPNDIMKIPEIKKMMDEGILSLVGVSPGSISGNSVSSMSSETAEDLLKQAMKKLEKSKALVKDKKKKKKNKKNKED